MDRETITLWIESTDYQEFLKFISSNPRFTLEKRSTGPNYFAVVREPVTQPPVANDSDLFEVAIEELELMVRGYNRLKISGIHTLGVLLLYTEEDLLDLRNYGEKTLRELQAKLQVRGLVLATSTPVKLPQLPDGIDLKSPISALGFDVETTQQLVAKWNSKGGWHKSERKSMISIQELASIKLSHISSSFDGVGDLDNVIQTLARYNIVFPLTSY